MAALFASLIKFLAPLVGIIGALAGVVSIVVGAVENPDGFVNTFLVKMIDNIAYVFPSTPDSLKVGNLISSISDSLPGVGKAVIFEVFQTISVIFGILIVIKIYKLIPFKAT